MKYFVGAYASSPCSTGNPWNPELESEYYQQLKSYPNIKGLEHPFMGQLHRIDDDWFLQNISTNWEFVFTCIPGIMSAMETNPHFGIASDNEAGRQQALEFLEKARIAITQLNAHCGKPVVKAVQIHTAPNRANASASVASLKASLSTIQEWDWQGARIMIEHCDTYLEHQTPEKGFLTIDEELEAISEVNQASNTDVGILINWARSVIETRSTQGAIEHIEKARDAGLLAGLIFSGVSDQDTEYGAWKDSHMPAAKATNGTIDAADSLLTETEIQQCMQVANVNQLDVIGIKIGIRPKDSSLEDRLLYIKENLAMLDSCI